jgi:hypothetical protein
MFFYVLYKLQFYTKIRLQIMWILYFHYFYSNYNLHKKFDSKLRVFYPSFNHVKLCVDSIDKNLWLSEICCIIHKPIFRHGNTRHFSSLSSHLLWYVLFNFFVNFRFSEKIINIKILRFAWLPRSFEFYVLKIFRRSGTCFI